MLSCFENVAPTKAKRKLQFQIAVQTAIFTALLTFTWKIKLFGYKNSTMQTIIGKITLFGEIKR